MKSFAKQIILFLLIFFVLNPLSFAERIKEPNCAGTFYPVDPKELSFVVEGFLSAANPAPVQENIPIIICPHAGYGFSGQTAAYAYKLIQGKPYKTVIIIGVSHFYGFGGISVYPDGKFRTPLGDLEVDAEFTEKLIGKDNDIFFDEAAFEKEHSVEVQLPFLQKILTGFKIVPIIVGDTTLETYRKLAQLLKEAIRQRNDCLVIASCDLYHGFDYEEAKACDEKTISLIKGLDAEAIYYGLREGSLEFKDGFPAVSAIILAKDLGLTDVKLLHHTNSAEVTGKKEKGLWTVGYGSFAIYGSGQKDNKGEVPMFNKDQRKELLEIARRSISEYLKTGKRPEIAEPDPQLVKEGGAFVTLTENSELRGCIGNLIAKEPLYLTIRDMAVEAATGDPRFSPLTTQELKNVNIEISVLSPLKRVSSAEEIVLGKHGVVVKKGLYSGVFLPQVATETGWSKEEFLSNLCAHKAGLAADAWKDKSTELYVFTAEIFSEKDFK